MKKILLPLLACGVALPMSGITSADQLDDLYGIANRPSYIKHYEPTKDGDVMLNPYLQVGTKEFPAVLDPSRPIYNYVITPEGGVALIEEAPHPYGRAYPEGFYRPEDRSIRKPGTVENFGHVSANVGGPARISGEIINSKEGKCWLVNNKSGRYSKRNLDRTPQQLFNAFNLIKSVVDPNGQPFCESAIYLVAYAPDYISKALRQSPDLVYENPKTKKNAHILLTPGKPIPQFAIPEYQHINLDAVGSGGGDGGAAAAAAAAKAKATSVKGKTTYNDDPS